MTNSPAYGNAYQPVVPVAPHSSAGTSLYDYFSKTIFRDAVNAPALIL